MEGAFLGISRIIRLGKKESEGMEAQEESTTMTKPKWDWTTPVPILVVLEEFNDIFPQALPLGIPLVHQGHSFKIDLKMRWPRSIDLCI